MNIQTRNKQQGFTLVEIAIVLVIIGLLLGGVLKGQELIESSKSKNAVNDITGVTTAFYAYIDRYRRTPGDDGDLTALKARGGNWATITAAGDVKGSLDITQAQVFTGGGEGVAFWQHLKAAGFINGNPADAGAAALPRNAFNGLTGVGPGVGSMGNSVCMSEVPGKAAAQIDAQLDDTVPDKGSVQATTGTAGANTAPGTAATVYDESKVYTLCRTL